tara:strand:+ start:101 stop:691 length:591 start_codon:yes stop_codon:yes gene_type:complete
MKCTYAIKNGEYDEHKLGYTENLKDRMRDLQIGNPFKLTITDTVQMPVINLLEEEKKMHNHFKDFHIRGEWYRVTEEQVKEYFNEVKKRYAQIKTIEGLVEHKPRYREHIRTAPPCYFYPEQQAQDKGMGSFYDKYRYRTMLWANVKEDHPSYASRDKKTGLSRVFISGRKHKENMHQMKFEEELNTQTTLEQHYA